MALKADELYAKHIKSLPVRERLRLLELTARGLAATTKGLSQKKRSLLELEGLGAEIWQGIEAQEYINQIRKEWDDRP
jgi:hypothetical protein